VENRSCPWRIGRPDACQSGLTPRAGKPLGRSADAGEKLDDLPLDPVTAQWEHRCCGSGVTTSFRIVRGQRWMASRWRPPIFSRKKGRCWRPLLHRCPASQMVRQGLCTYQAALGRALPDTVEPVRQLSAGRAGGCSVAFSDQDPGTLFCCSTGKAQVTPLATRMSWIKPAQMAPHAFLSNTGARRHRPSMGS